MSSEHIFALPYTRGLHVTTDLAIPIKGKKRKWGKDDDSKLDPEDTGAAGEDPNYQRSSTSPARAAFLTPEQREQYNLAGLDPREEVPPHPFPHAPPGPLTSIWDRVRHEMQGLKPPLAHVDPSYYEPTKQNVQDEDDNLREKHLAVLSTILHSSLLKGDYQRAGRAWGLLLRSGGLAKNVKRKDGYLSMDVTANNRWGIGAEILMRKNGIRGRGRSPKQGMTRTSSTPENMDFSEEGFPAARGYYERLIVQYPEHHQRKGAKASTFYAAMFSLWIYEVAEKSKLAEQKPINSEMGSSQSPESGHLASDDSQDSTGRQRRAIKSKELESAEAIASRLDEVLGSPPYDKNAELLQIRGMVALWIGNLRGDDARELGVERAKILFLRAQKNGGTLWEGVESIVVDDDW